MIKILDRDMINLEEGIDRMINSDDFRISRPRQIYQGSHKRNLKK